MLKSSSLNCASANFEYLFLSLPSAAVVTIATDLNGNVSKYFTATRRTGSADNPVEVRIIFPFFSLYFSPPGGGGGGGRGGGGGGGGAPPRPGQKGWKAARLCVSKETKLAK